MEHLWSPWRYRYVSKAGPSAECIFCSKASVARDAENLVVHRAGRNFVILNLYPYTSGHLMIAPYEHVATLGEAADGTIEEMMRLTRSAEQYLREIYKPEGMNIGMNLGHCAGAGVAGHIHMHVVPRWIGDANFMTTVGETRVLPESLEDAYAKLSAAFRR
ncbi:MAG: HIT family protein [Bryobacteraceae bacterium]